MKILLATKNKHKKLEIKALFKGTNIEILSLDDVGFTGDIVEDGNTFRENAEIKAKAIYQIYKIPTLADDSGICIDALAGEPGIHSARFGGYDTPSKVKNQMIIDLLKGQENRNAHYTCAIYFIDNEVCFSTEKSCYGQIIDHEKGIGGFGYDPIFYIENFRKTMAQISLAEKNKISHRGQALAEFKSFIENKYSKIF